MSGKKKKPYFPNNWQLYKDADDELFMPHTYEEVVVWKLRGWELPSSVNCIIRTTDLATKKVKEHVYRYQGAADNKFRQLLQDRTHEITIVDHDETMFFSPRPKRPEHDDAEL